MDQKKKITMKKWCLIWFFFILTLPLVAQDVKEIRFCDKKYEYGIGKDSITLFLKAVNSDGSRAVDVSVKDLENYLVVKEDGRLITSSDRSIQAIDNGQRIPADYTFSVVVDQNISKKGKNEILDLIEKLVGSTPDSCVYLSFFGEDVSSSIMATRKNIEKFRNLLNQETQKKHFYGALYAKLAEFSLHKSIHEESAHLQKGYKRCFQISERAAKNPNKNILFIFTEGKKSPDVEDIKFYMVTDYESVSLNIVPRVYAFYYTADGIDDNVKQTLEGVTTPKDSLENVIVSRKGAYLSSDNMENVLAGFEQIVKDAMYDFSFTYKATSSRQYLGKVAYNAEWKGEEKGTAVFSIGTAENPWPLAKESLVDAIIKYLTALLVTVLTVLVFFSIIKILIPFAKSQFFAMKYYRKYVEEENVQKRICHYCKQVIIPGELIVSKCKHIMHIQCWRQNGYKCAEYGQNCKTGIQEHVEWRELFRLSALRDCHQTIAGICAGLFSWVIYELIGRGGFTFLAKKISDIFYVHESQLNSLYETCVTKVSAFLTIGLLLGIFLSLIFRYNDEYRRKNRKVYLKIFVLSLFSGIVGFFSFAVGAIVLCSLLSIINVTYIPWYCSFPAYLLFSICTSLSLTVQSSIPVKSAVLGGACSAIIGFIVLYFSSVASTRFGWMNMLLDFVIYGGGLGASLVTVRMLAEKYFLVIQNGVKAGQRIPIHKWMNATGGGNKVSIGMTGECEVQMNWEKSNKVAKEHAQLFIDHTKSLPMIKPLATGVIFNMRAELPVGKPSVLANGDTFKIGDTIFLYSESY